MKIQHLTPRLNEMDQSIPIGKPIDPYRWWNFERNLMRCYHGTRSAFLADIKQNGLVPPDTEMHHYVDRIIDAYLPGQHLRKGPLYDAIHKDVNQFRDRFTHLNTNRGPIVYCYPAPHWERSAGYARRFAEDGGEIRMQVHRQIKRYYEDRGGIDIPKRFPSAFPIVVEVLVPHHLIVNLTDFQRIANQVRRPEYEQFMRKHDEEGDVDTWLDDAGEQEVWVRNGIPANLIQQIWRIGNPNARRFRDGFQKSVLS